MIPLKPMFVKDNKFSNHIKLCIYFVIVDTPEEFKLTQTIVQMNQNQLIEQHCDVTRLPSIKMRPIVEFL